MKKNLWDELFKALDETTDAEWGKFVEEFDKTHEMELNHTSISKNINGYKVSPSYIICNEATNNDYLIEKDFDDLSMAA